MRVRVILLFVSWIICHALNGQHIYNSPYSVYGLGMINENYSSFNRGMGGTGIGLRDASNLNHVNPASYGAISPVSHVFEIGAYVESNRFQTAEDKDSKSNGGLTSLSYWFKFKSWWSSVAGIAPLSTTAYHINTNRALGVGNEANYIYEGKGNISKLYLGNSFAITKNFAVGVNVSYLFGSIKRNETITNATNSSSVTLLDKTFSRGANLDFGAQYSFQLEKRLLTIGVIYDNKLTLKGTSDLLLYDDAGDTLVTKEGEKSRYTMPGYLGGGVALKSRRSIISMDAKLTKWSSASYGNQNAAFKDVMRMSFGYAYTGDYNAVSYAGLIGFRTGIYFQPYPVVIKGESFNTFGGALGVSFPVFDNKSSINFTYTYDQMGTTRNDLVSQHTHKFILDIIIRDLWGVRRKFD